MPTSKKNHPCKNQQQLEQCWQFLLPAFDFFLSPQPAGKAKVLDGLATIWQELPAVAKGRQDDARLLETFITLQELLADYCGPLCVMTTVLAKKTGLPPLLVGMHLLPAYTGLLFAPAEKHLVRLTDALDTYRLPGMTLPALKALWLEKLDLRMSFYGETQLAPLPDRTILAVAKEIMELLPKDLLLRDFKEIEIVAILQSSLSKIA
ncbi:MAG: hypothetical protein WCI30_00780 [Clostridia bacterium]